MKRTLMITTLCAAAACVVAVPAHAQTPDNQPRPAEQQPIPGMRQRAMERSMEQPPLRDRLQRRAAARPDAPAEPPKPQRELRQRGGRDAAGPVREKIKEGVIKRFDVNGDGRLGPRERLALRQAVRDRIGQRTMPHRPFADRFQQGARPQDGRGLQRGFSPRPELPRFQQAQPGNRQGMRGGWARPNIGPLAPMQPQPNRHMAPGFQRPGMMDRPHLRQQEHGRMRMRGQTPQDAPHAPRPAPAPTPGPRTPRPL